MLIIFQGLVQELHNFCCPGYCVFVGAALAPRVQKHAAPAPRPWLRYYTKLKFS